jgi:hypothetical protein
MNREKPVHEIRIAALKGVIWKSATQNGVRYNVTFARLYKEDDKWKSTHSFGRNDLLLLAKVADRAHTWIHDQAVRQRNIDSAH